MIYKKPNFSENNKHGESRSSLQRLHGSTRSLRLISQIIVISQKHHLLSTILEKFVKIPAYS